MRILYCNLPLGIPSYQPLKPNGGIIAAAILGAVGLAGAGIAASSNSANIAAAADLNAENRAWQSREAQKARQWSRDEWNRQFKINEQDWLKKFNLQSDFSRSLMNESNELEQSNWLKQFNLQNEYNDPSAQVARLQSAGLNPALVLGNGSASGMMAAPSAPPVSAPSAPSPSQAIPALSNILAGTPQTTAPHSDVSWATQLLGTLGDVANKLTSAGVNNAQLKRMMETLPSYIRQEFGKAETQELMNNAQKISNFISERTKDVKVQKEYSEFDNLWKDLQVKASQIELNRVMKDEVISQKDLNEMNTILSQMQSNKAWHESELLGLQVSNWYEDFKNRQNLYKAQTNAANASAYESTEAARLHIAETAFTNMETDLFSLKKVAQTLENGIKSNEFKASSLGLEVDEASQLFKLIQEADKLDDIKDKWNLWNKVRKIKNLLGFQMSVGIHN